MIIWKSGKTDAGARAAASHTGSLAGSYPIPALPTTQTNGYAVYTLRGMPVFTRIERAAKAVSAMVRFNGGND